jgi:hypothetical protein
MSAAQAGPRQQSTHGDPMRLAVSLLALAAGPAAWSGQLIIDYAVASELCFGRGAPRATPPASGWTPEHLLLLAVNLACLALAAAGGIAALAAWRRTRRDGPGEAAGPAAASRARRRFLAVCGVLSASVFAVAILFNTASPLFVSSCWRFTP